MDDTTPQKPVGPTPEGAPAPQPEQPAEPAQSTAAESSPSEPTQPVPAATPPLGPSSASRPGAVPPGEASVGPGQVPVPPGAGQPVGWTPVPAAAAPRRSIWRDAVSTTGGKIATITAVVAVAVVGLLVLGLVVGAVVRHGRFDRTAAPWQDQRSAPGVPRDRMGPMGGMPGWRGDGRGDDGLPGLGLGQGQVQHGEFTATGADGQTRTLTLQRGSVTAASSSSVTVRSADGFTATYKIDDSTRLNARGSALATGQTAVVLADKDTKTALRVLRRGVVD